MRYLISVFLLVLLVALAADQDQKDFDVVDHLQKVSVTIKAKASEGSGVITTVGGTNYVWTAGHVVDACRKVVSTPDEKGVIRTKVEFDDVDIVKDVVEDGRKVGEIKFSAVVLRYSDVTKHDLALLKVRKKKLFDYKTDFYLDEKIPKLGTDLYHVGSFLGQFGSNSLSTGVYSQVGRVMNGVLYDNTNCTIFPGSSGGGVFLKNNGQYVGMVVRGAGEGFNFIVPMRRLAAYAKDTKVDFTINPALPVPKDEEVSKHPIE